MLTFLPYFENIGTMNLEEKFNVACVRCKNKTSRASDEFGLCKTVRSLDDGLPVRCVGSWAKEKIYYLTRYFDIFATGMQNKFNLNYIEICSGPGRCICRESQGEIDGTALAIVKHVSFQHIEKAVFIDYSSEVVDTLNERFRKLGTSGKAKAFLGNYNDLDTLKNAFAELKLNSLNLVFIDPTDCGIPFSTIEFIAKKFAKVDFILNVATYTDIGRNLKNIFERGYNDDKYKAFLGKNYANMSDKIDFSKMTSADARRLFKDAYIENFKSIGFNYSRLEKIEHYYDLLFVSKSKKGLDFWEKISKIKPDNQRTLGI